MRYRLVKGLLLQVISFYRSCLRLKQYSLSTWSEVILCVVIITSEVYATTFRYQISGGGWYDKKKHGMESLGWPQVRAVSDLYQVSPHVEVLIPQLYHSHWQDLSPCSGSILGEFSSHEVLLQSIQNKKPCFTSTLPLSPFLPLLSLSPQLNAPHTKGSTREIVLSALMDFASTRLIIWDLLMMNFLHSPASQPLTPRMNLYSSRILPTQI